MKAVETAVPTGTSPSSTDAPLHAVICDDAALNRECLAMALKSYGVETDCVGDLPALLGRLDRGVPDVILLDIAMPESATLLQVGLDVGPDVRVIVTGLREDRESEIVSCAEAGATGLHLRTETLEELLNLIRNPAHDEAVCSPKVSAILLRRVYSMVCQRNPTPDHQGPALTDREAQIMRLLEEGLSNQQIATRLNVTIHTVKNHARSLFSKLGVSSRAEAVATYRALRFSNGGSA